MRRAERRLLRINNELEQLRREEQLVAGELEMHRHLADDAARDAVVYEGTERADARDAVKDVSRQERVLESTRRAIGRLEAKRDRVLDRLQSG